MSVEISAGAGDNRDVPVSVFDQVLDNSASAAGVVDVDGVEGSPLERAVEEYDWMAVGKICHECFRIDVGRHDDHAIDSAAHCAHGAFDLAFVLVGIGDNQVITAASCCEVDATDHFGEEFAVEVGEENSDSAGFAGDQASGAAVRDVAKAGGDVADSAACFFADGAAAVEDAGNSSDGDVCLTGNVLDCDHRSGLGRGTVPRACCSVIRRQFPLRVVVLM